jgi:hypothetical protein
MGDIHALFFVRVIALLLVAACGPDSTSVPIDGAVTPPTHSIVVSRTGTGGDVITAPEASISCGASCTSGVADGPPVTFTETADVGSTFVGWTGAGS